MSLTPEEGASGLSMRQLTSILRAYWKLSVGVGSALLLLTIAFLLTLPKSFTATATLMISYQNRDPLAGEQLPLALLGNYVATQAELITSPAVLMRVVDRLGLMSDPDYTRGYVGGAAAVKDLVEKNLSKDIVVDEGRGGEILYISATARDAAKAARLANAVTDVYLEQETDRLSVPASERAERYSEHLAELRSKVAAAQDQVTRFREKNNLTDGAGVNADVEAQALTALEQRLLEAQNARRAAESKATQAAGSSDAAQASPLVEELKVKLTTLEGQLAQLRSTLGAQHPRILEVQSQIAATRESLAAEYRSLGDNSSAELRSARELEEKFQRAVDQQRTKLLAVRTLQDEGSKLSLELESAQTVYRRALDGYDQIMFASTGSHTNVNIISRAIPPAQASKGKKLKFLAAGFVVAVLLALGVPLMYELFLRRRVRCRDDLERNFNLPVLAELDALPEARA